MSLTQKLAIMALGISFAPVLGGCDDGAKPDGGGGDAKGLIDCTDSAQSQTDVCVRPSNSTVYFGEGPSIDGLPPFGGQYFGGVIDPAGNRLLIGVGWGLDDGRQGMVMAIDVDTGDRTVLSGQYEDPAAGKVVTGAGPELGFVRDVALGRDGALYVLNSPNSADESEVLEIDPATGDRAYLWVQGDPAYGQCVINGSDALLVPWSFAVDNDGSFYFAVAEPFDSATGIVKLSPDGAACTVVSLWGSDPEAVRGAGPETNATFTGLRLRDGALLAIDGQNKGLFRFDPATGDRTRLSNPELGVGPEIGTQWLDWDARGEGVWTSGAFAGNSTVLTRVVLASGDREAVPLEAGPAYYGLQSGGAIFQHPTKDLLLMVVDSYAVVLLDPASGNSNNLSL